MFSQGFVSVRRAIRAWYWLVCEPKKSTFSYSAASAVFFYQHLGNGVFPKLFK